MYLLASTLLGGLYLIILFGLCFGGVAGVKYLQYIRRRQASAPPEKKAEPPKETKQPEKPNEIYYIVEKKRARSKQKLSEPKKIRFE